MNSKGLARWLAASLLAFPLAVSTYTFGQQQASPDSKAQKSAEAAGRSDVVLVALVGNAPATAANLPAPPPPPPSMSGNRWSGPHIGINLGYGSGNGDTFVNPLPTAAIFINLLPQTLHPNPTGFVGGGQFGYDWQRRWLVVGAEADINGSKMSGSKTVSPIVQNNGTPFPGGLVFAHQDTAWYGTLRPRLGFGTSRFLVYGTGGLAYGRVNYNGDTDFRPVGTTQYLAAPSRTQRGWTAGGGVEVALSQRWSAKGEFLHYDLGTLHVVANPQFVFPPFQVGYTWQTTANLSRFGLNYRF